MTEKQESPKEELTKEDLLKEIQFIYKILYASGTIEKLEGNKLFIHKVAKTTESPKKEEKVEESKGDNS